MIQFETLRRLYFGNGLSLDEIDATGALPPLRAGNRDGLIYKMTQRCVASSTCRRRARSIDERTYAETNFSGPG